jgi:hypothetical protein
VPVNPRRLLLDEPAGWRLSPQIQQDAEPLGGLLALLAGLYEDGVHAVAVRRGLVAYLALLEDRFLYVPSDVVIPGIAEAGDVAEVAAALAPRALLLEQLVDGGNRAVPEPELRSRLAPVLKAYSAQPKSLLLRGGEGGIGTWIAGQIGH